MIHRCFIVCCLAAITFTARADDAPALILDFSKGDNGVQLVNGPRVANGHLEFTNAVLTIPATGGVDVVYARFSSELQRTESVDDQEPRCREGLRRMGVDDKTFILLADEAISGKRDSRPASTSSPWPSAIQDRQPLLL